MLFSMQGEREGLRRCHSSTKGELTGGTKVMNPWAYLVAFCDETVEAMSHTQLLRYI